MNLFLEGYFSAIETFIEKDTKNRKYLYSWCRFWSHQANHFSRCFKSPTAPSTNLSEAFNSRYVQTNDTYLKLVDAAKSDAAYAISLDRQLSLYAEGANTKGRGAENLRAAKDFKEQRKRATTNPETDTSKGSDRPERKRCGRSQRFVKSLKMAKTMKNSASVSHTEKTSNETTISLECRSTVTNKETVVDSQIQKCSCKFFVYMKEKEACMHIIWVFLNVFEVPEESYLLHQIGFTLEEVENHLSK